MPQSFLKQSGNDSAISALPDQLLFEGFVDALRSSAALDGDRAERAQERDHVAPTKQLSVHFAKSQIILRIS